MPKPTRRLVLLALAAAATSSAAGCSPSCQWEAPTPVAGTVVVYIVRHAEKQPVSDAAPEAERDDPPLAPAGQLRALGLAEDLPVRDITAVYVTNTKRSRETASAVMAVNGVGATIYPPHDARGLADRIRARRGESVLVVGHSNTIPALFTELGVADPLTIADDQYGDLWVVTLTGDVATVERREYGETVDRFDPG